MGCDEGSGFLGVGDEGLLYQHVFAGAEGAQRPFVVEAIGEGDIDCVDGGVVEEGYVGAGGFSIFYAVRMGKQ